MTKYNVTVQFEANDIPGLKDVPVDAVSMHATAEWVTFSSDRAGGANNSVAAFPTSRVVSIITTD